MNNAKHAIVSSFWLLFFCICNSCLLLRLWFSLYRPQGRADCALAPCANLTCLLETISLAAHLSGVLTWPSGLWVASVALPSVFSAQHQNQNHIQSAAHSITYCGLSGCQHLTFLSYEQIQTVFRCCLLCSGKTVRLINLTCQKSLLEA